VARARVQALSPPDLPSFIRSHLSSSSFEIYAHILTEPFISVLCSLPPEVKAFSRIYLDEEKDQVNRYAARALRRCGYRWLYWVRKLHAKMIVADSFVVVGSANFSERAITQNYEVVIVVWSPPHQVEGLMGILRRIRGRAVRVRDEEIIA